MTQIVQNTKPQRDIYIDIIKGIGILSIVIGHSSWNIQIGNLTVPIGPFVYLYHLAIFFFCSGYLFRNTYSDIWGFIAKKLKGLMKPFIIYTLIYLVFRNLFIDLGILAAEKFTMGKLLIALANMITFNGVSEFLAAFWFLPVLFFALCFYAVIDFISNHISNKPIKYILKVSLIAVLGIAGLLAAEKGYGLLYNLQTAFLMVPVIALGHLYQIKKKFVDKFINVIGLVVSFIVMVIVLRADIGIVELSKNMIINRYLFYPVTICGIYFCLCLAKLLSKIKGIDHFFALIGRMSFDIMAIQFLGIKLVDLVACHILHRTDIMNAFPYSFTTLWPFYYVAGVGIPLLLKYVWMKSYQFLKPKISTILVLK